jgi:TRAP transporter 4TM/12TM fusion protein
MKGVEIVYNILKKAVKMLQRLPNISHLPNWERFLIIGVSLFWCSVELWGGLTGLLSVKELEIVGLWFSLFFAFLFYNPSYFPLPRLLLYGAVVVTTFPLLYFFFNPSPLFLSRWALIGGGVLLLLLLLAGVVTKNGFFSIFVGGMAILALVGGKFTDYFPSLTLEQLTLNLFFAGEGIWGTPLEVAVRYIFPFLLIGYLLEELKVGEILIYLFSRLFGRERGGVAKASILTTILMGSFSSSSTANALITGVFTIPAMVKSGLTREESATFEAVASTNSQLIPPIMGVTAFLIAEALGIEYFQVALTATIPAIMVVFGLYFLVDITTARLGKCKTRRFPKIPLLPLRLLFFLFSLLLFLGTLAFHPLPMEVIASGIVLFLIGLIFLIYILQYGVKIGAPLALKKVVHALIEGTSGAGIIVIITAMAGIITTLITLLGIPELLSFFLPQTQIGFGGFLLMVGMVALLGVIAGIGLPTTATYLVLVSFIVPLFQHLTAQSNLYLPLLTLHFFIFYFGILADIIPPTGITLYAVASIAHLSPLKIGVKALQLELRTIVIPFLFLLNPYFLLIDPTSDQFKLVDSPILIGAILLSAIGGIYAFIHLIYQRKIGWGRRLFLTGALLLFWGVPSLSLFLIPKAVLQLIGGYGGLFYWIGGKIGERLLSRPRTTFSAEKGALPIEKG